MHWRDTARRVVPLEHREIDDPQKLELACVDQVHTAGNVLSDPVERRRRYLVGGGDVQAEVSFEEREAVRSPFGEEFRALSLESRARSLQYDQPARPGGLRHALELIRLLPRERRSEEHTSELQSQS